MPRVCSHLGSSYNCFVSILNRFQQEHLGVHSMAEEVPPQVDSKTRVIILTGPVGSGKTSLLNSLLQMRPLEDRWAVLVNDIGKTEVDTTVTSDVEVRTVHGACMSGVNTGVPLRSALLQMLKRPRPQYLLIELSTLGMPLNLRRNLQNTFNEVAIVHSVIALVPKKRHLELLEANAVYRSQLEQADVLVLHQCDDEGPGSEIAGDEQTLSLVQYEKRMVVWQRGSGKQSSGLSEDVAIAELLAVLRDGRS